MTFQNECVLMDRECIDCGECDICDLDSSKICDNCCKCIDTDADYRGVYIDDIIDNDVENDSEDIDLEKFDADVTEKIE